MCTNWRLGLDISFIYVTVCSILFMPYLPDCISETMSYYGIECNYSLFYGVLILLYRFYFITSGRYISVLQFLQRNMCRGRHFLQRSGRHIRSKLIPRMQYWINRAEYSFLQLLATITCWVILAMQIINYFMSNESMIVVNPVGYGLRQTYTTWFICECIANETADAWLSLGLNISPWLSFILKDGPLLLAMIICLLVAAYIVAYCIYISISLIRDVMHGFVRLFYQPSAVLSHAYRVTPSVEQYREMSEVERKQLVQKWLKERNRIANVMADKEHKQFMPNNDEAGHRQMPLDVEVSFHTAANKLIAEEIKGTYLSIPIDSDGDGMADGHFQAQRDVESEHVKQNKFDKIGSQAVNLTETVKNDIDGTLKEITLSGKNDLISIHRDEETGENIHEDDLKAELEKSNHLTKTGCERTLRAELSTEDGNLNGQTSDAQLRESDAMNLIDIRFIYGIY